MAQTVIGLFDNRQEALQAVEQLETRGISRDNIDISNRGSSSDLSTSTSTTTNTHEEHESGIERFFRNLFGDDDEDSKKYRTVADEADCIVTVHAQSQDEAERAADILDDNGAVNVEERASQYGYNSSSALGSTSSALGGSSSALSHTSNTIGNTSSDAFSTTTDNTTEKVEVIKEDLEVGKREIQTGGVRLRSRIVERPVEESLRLREERVHVTRNPVNREVRTDELSNFQERDIELIEHAEVPVVSKTARVVEEVSLNKDVEDRVETISDTVRSTEVDVENIDKDSINRQSSQI